MPQDLHRFEKAVATADWLRGSIRDYEPHRLHFLTETLTELIIARAVEAGDVVADAGANHGYHTRHLLAAVGAAGHVHAFEPNPALAAELESWNDPRLIVHRAAVGAHTGTAMLHVPVDDDGWGSLLTDHISSDRELNSYAVDVARIDGALCPGDVLAFVKLDVERSEDAALEGMGKLLSAQGPLVVFEDAADNTAARRLGALGYEVMDLLGRPLDESDHQLVNLLAVPRTRAAEWRYWPDRRAVDEVSARFRARFGRRRQWEALRRRLRGVR
jgi:FkbM family methyltransferase